MKRFMCVLFLLVVCVPFGLGKVDFTKPAPVRVFEPIQPQQTVKNKSTNANVQLRKANTVPAVPANVLPISIYNEEEDWKYAPCAAMRLNANWVLTAAHCFAEGNMKHGNRLFAKVITPLKGTNGLVLASATTDNIAKPNAQLFFYRPGYSPTRSEGNAFDFALIKLDDKLQFNAQFAKRELEKALAQMPEQIQEQLQIRQQLEQEMQKEFNKEQNAYKRFMSTPLQTFDLLQMSPDLVVEELANRTLSAYFWNGLEGTFEREPLQVLKGFIEGTDARNQHNTHTLIFGFPFFPGTSGSPVLDMQRKLIVSVASGATETTGVGGLISAEVCTWVKSHDPSVRCLVVERNSGAIYSETSATAAWGR